MNELLKINYETEQPTVSARDLHEQLHIDTPFKKWIDRMCEYGFESKKDFWTKMSESTGGRPSTEYMLTIDMAKQICMIQRSPEGKQIRQYFLDLEKAWNTPEQVFARALKMADQQIEKLKSNNAVLIKDVERMRDFCGCRVSQPYIYSDRRSCKAFETERIRNRTETFV